MRASVTNHDSAALALQSLAWTLSDGARADRLLTLTGLDANALRARVGEPGLLAAALGFLESHEPDLIACAAALGVQPGTLIAARAELEA